MEIRFLFPSNFESIPSGLIQSYLNWHCVVSYLHDMVFGIYFSNFMTYFWMLWGRKYIKVIWFLNCVVLKKEVGLQNGVGNLFRPRVFQSKENTGIDLLWQMIFIELSITKPQIILIYVALQKNAFLKTNSAPI